MSLFFRDCFILRSDEKTLQVIASHEAICIIEFIFQKDLKYKTKIPRYLGMAITFCHPKQCEVFQLLSLFFRDSFILRSDEKTLQVIARHEAICIIEFIFQKDLKYKTKIPRYLGMAITFCHPKQCEVFQLLSLFFRDCFILRSDEKTLQVIVRHEAISIIEFIFQKDLKYKTKISRYNWNGNYFLSS